MTTRYYYPTEKNCIFSESCHSDKQFADYIFTYLIKRLDKNDENMINKKIIYMKFNFENDATVYYFKGSRKLLEPPGTFKLANGETITYLYSYSTKRLARLHKDYVLPIASTLIFD